MCMRVVPIAHTKICGHAEPQALVWGQVRDRQMLSAHAQLTDVTLNVSIGGVLVLVEITCDTASKAMVPVLSDTSSN